MLKALKIFKFPVIVTKECGDLLNGGSFYKDKVPFFRKTHGLPVGFNPNKTGLFEGSFFW